VSLALSYFAADACCQNALSMLDTSFGSLKLVRRSEMFCFNRFLKA
jgi:hypothetical protein